MYSLINSLLNYCNSVAANKLQRAQNNGAHVVYAANHCSDAKPLLLYQLH